MVTLQIGARNSFDDYGLVLTGREIGCPEEKRIQIDVPFANGVLDLTGYFGDTYYSNRTIKVDFTITDLENPTEVYSTFLAYSYYSPCEIYFSDDICRGKSCWTYTCVSMKVSKLKKTNKLYGFSVEMECEPYKFGSNSGFVHSVTNAETGETVITCTNRGIPVVPHLIPVGSGTVTVDDETYEFTDEGDVVPEIILDTGETELIVNGGLLFVIFSERML